MKNANTVIPCYSADTAGVCSALYELGGMTVVHDASGCNSTYSTHDEPRWYDTDSMIYISALTEMDAIMGNDEKIISDTAAAAADLKPAFIALCGSPMPMMTGVDFDALAKEVEQRTGIRTFGMHTNGTRPYTEGASQAFEAVAKEYVHECPKADGIGVNILGATPLDLPLEGTMDSIKKWLSENGLEYVSCFAMGSSLDEIKNAAAARVNLVVSCSGIAAAEYMKDRFAIPYVCGLPVGKGFAEKLARALKQAADSGENVCALKRGVSSDIVVIGESIGAASVAAALSEDEGREAAVISPLAADGDILSEGDLEIYAEEDIKAALEKMQPQTVIADPLYRYILPKGCEHIEIAHFAFSGRCFTNKMPDLINREIKFLQK